MSAARKTTVGVVFGGRSVEHDVSIVTGHQVMRAFDPEHYEVVPIYISRDGKWFTGEPLNKLENFKDREIISYKGVLPAIISPDIRHHGLIINPISKRFSQNTIKRLDVVFPALHGSHGEDGTIQGLLELADIPYVGCTTLSSALTNHKLITKQVLEQNGIRVVPAVSLTRAEWLDQPDAIIERILQRLTFPVFIKPVTLGSSIGVSRATTPESVRSAVDVAVNFDRHVLVENGIDGIEINCAVIGAGSQIQASVLEQPLSWADFLSYEDKYLRGGEGMKSAERIIPAPIPAELAARIQQTAIESFRAVDGRGTARIDFLVKPDQDEIYVNEINTMPGSLAFYLWREVGLPPREVVNKLAQIARDAHAEKRQSIYDYETNLIAVAAAKGLKGIKGAKSSS